MSKQPRDCSRRDRRQPEEETEAQPSNHQNAYYQMLTTIVDDAVPMWKSLAVQEPEWATQTGYSSHLAQKLAQRPEVLR